MIDYQTIDEQAWRDYAACVDSGLDFFDLTLSNAHKCIAICRECRVQDECLDASINPRWEAYGLWGGLRPEPRRGVRRKEQTARRAGG